MVRLKNKLLTWHKEHPYETLPKILFTSDEAVELAKLVLSGEVDFIFIPKNKNEDNPELEKFINTFGQG